MPCRRAFAQNIHWAQVVHVMLGLMTNMEMSFLWATPIAGWFISWTGFTAQCPNSMSQSIHEFLPRMFIHLDESSQEEANIKHHQWLQNMLNQEIVHRKQY